MAFVGYQIFLSVSKIKNNTEQRMAKHNSKQFSTYPLK